MMEYHDWGYGSWGMDRIARWGMDRGMDRGVWIACGPGPLIHTLYFDLHPNDGQYTLWLFNVAMENDPFIVDFPIKTSIFRGFSMAMLNNQRVHMFGGYFWRV